MNNVHDGVPVTFQTRWAMSFLAGPLARKQISELMADRKQAIQDRRAESCESVSKEPPAPERPVTPSGIDEVFLAPSERPQRDCKTLYRPGLLGKASLHFIRASAALDYWVDTTRLLRCGGGVPNELWDESVELPVDTEFHDEPDDDFTFSELPDAMRGKSPYRAFRSKLKDYLYRHRSTTLYKCPGVKGYAPDARSEADARLYFQQQLREKRALETEKLRDKNDSKMDSLEKKMRTAEDRVQRESSQYDQAKWSSLLSVGSSILGAFSERRRGGVMTAARGVGRASQQKDDIRRAEQALNLLHDDMAELESELSDELQELAEACDLTKLELETSDIPPRKSDLKVQDIAIVWTPWQVDADGIAMPLFETLPADHE